MTATPIAEYEVFKNDKNALAFFFHKQDALDANAKEGPFWFSVQNGSIRAGTEAHHVHFEDVKPEILDIARNRGVIMLMEFDGQKPVRCTPCYLAAVF